ncbi:fibroblast growth factor 8 precursor [Tribolium castaneum]|uniref:Fibroblast growth factor 8 n=1 Tax=Tribolium castaneum TaxID=7070 RepID=D6WBE2_TRICA|nr:fibroblast growth factor 8 precursor [Tribolium castaneum]EEZ99186.1 fibroblast growth factor 8 [Tribolium castaneum]|eukprot:NP_001164153.1 fibroblast growth factor 8 precursor [Tribolium castaneum]
MHPNVYKKHHKPHYLILVLLCVMILCQPVTSEPNPCNVGVRKTKIFSPFTKGYLRIEANKVVAKEKEDFPGDREYLYKVTVEHSILLYHIKSGKFICWNRNYNRLIAKRNPPTLDSCKFQELVSHLDPNVYVRYSTIHKNKEKEIQFNRRGDFLNRCRLKKYCQGLKRDRHICQMTCNNKMSTDFLPDDDCDSSFLSDFCGKMKLVKLRGHSITSEIVDVCKHEWNKSH